MSKSATTSKTLSASLPKPWKPHAYQKQAMKWLLEHASAGLFLDPGLGKTSITLGALKVLRRRGVSKGALVVAPLRVCHAVWPEEVKAWSDFAGTRVEILHDAKKEDALSRDADIYLINPEGLKWLFGPPPLTGKPDKNAPPEDHRAWAVAWAEYQKEKARAAPLIKRLFECVDTLVVDESTKFKHANKKRFKILKQFFERFARRWILTGSPAPNGYEDLFGQCYVMDMGRALGQYITHYRRKYFYPTGFGGFDYVLRDGADREINERLKDSVLHFAAEDHIDMPERVDNVIHVDLPPKVRQIYDDVEQEFFAIIEGQELSIANAAVAGVKCRQIANGGVNVGREGFKLLHDAKREAVADLVEEMSGQPALVIYEFQHDLHGLRETFGKPTPHIGGGVTAAQTSKTIAAWNTGKLPVLLGQPASMGHGLNLQSAGHHIIMHSLIWDFELVDQVIRRVYRQGQKSKRVFVHWIVARNTVDELILPVLRDKELVQKSFLAYMKGRK